MKCNIWISNTCYHILDLKSKISQNLHIFVSKWKDLNQLIRSKLEITHLVTQNTDPSMFSLGYFWENNENFKYDCVILEK